MKNKKVIPLTIENIYKYFYDKKTRKFKEIKIIEIEDIQYNIIEQNPLYEKAIIQFFNKFKKTGKFPTGKSNNMIYQFLCGFVLARLKKNGYSYIFTPNGSIEIVIKDIDLNTEYKTIEDETNIIYKTFIQNYNKYKNMSNKILYSSNYNNKFKKGFKENKIVSFKYISINGKVEYDKNNIDKDSGLQLCSSPLNVLANNYMNGNAFTII